MMKYSTNELSKFWNNLFELLLMLLAHFSFPLSYILTLACHWKSYFPQGSLKNSVRTQHASRQANHDALFLKLYYGECVCATLCEVHLVDILICKKKNRFFFVKLDFDWIPRSGCWKLDIANTHTSGSLPVDKVRYWQVHFFFLFLVLQVYLWGRRKKTFGNRKLVPFPVSIKKALVKRVQGFNRAGLVSRLVESVLAGFCHYVLFVWFLRGSRS